MTLEPRTKIERLHGPVVVLGASGFIGANLLRMLLQVRNDVYGTALQLPAWRLEGLPERNVVAVDLLVHSNLTSLLDQIKPQTVFNCVAYGAYSFERDTDLIYRTNLNFTVTLLEELARRDVHCYVQAGSSSEYGASSAAPSEEAAPTPNSHYAASKAAAAGVVYYMGKKRGLPCANLRLYSVYGPYEDSSRLIPAVVAQGMEDSLPSFVDPDISRDFVYVEDACRAFVDTALSLEPARYGESFNIGSGRQTTIREVADVARKVFEIEELPEFTMAARDWDVTDWYADPRKARSEIGWEGEVCFEEGLRRTADWFRELEDVEAYRKASKEFALDDRHSVSAVVACYQDASAIPLMYERLSKVFQEMRVDYEIIFVNDCSPDDSEEVIRRLSARDRRVIGISHSRNFGSQAAFRSGMEVASKRACVLLDGDLQDPPELIEQFVEKWRDGYDVVFGRRVKRDAPLYMQLAYKLFYRLFDRFSYLKIPHDAGDFSLLDRKVVRCLLRFPERDLFLRGVRAFVGFRQVGIDYVRPERMFGASTNNLLKNVGWAKKGILSFSHTPLNMLSAFGVISLGVVAVLGFIQILAKLAFPDLAPRGLTTLTLVIMGFGAINLFAVGLLGEYIAKIFEEVKQRPHFVRRSIIRDGELRDASEERLRIVDGEG
jgi:dolichol-phosphate mannosyltransferase